MRRIGFTILVWALFVMITIGAVENPFSRSYVQEIRQDASMVTAEQEDPLLSQIKHAAKQYHIAPENAVVDKVWKAIPGYNGRTVDVMASYERMKDKGRFSSDLLVFKELSPDIHLEELPPSPVYRGHPKKPEVAFLINVAWGNEHIPPILKVLNKKNVKATFFLDGSWTKNNPKLARMIAEEGHEIGNHGCSHKEMKTLPSNHIREEITKANAVIEATTDKKPSWFAPPAGSYRQDVVNIAREEHLFTVLWSVDTIDWKEPDPTSMIQRVLNNIHPGATVLMHPTSPTAQGLEQMIEGAREQGFEPVTMSKLVDESRKKDIKDNQLK